MSNLNNIGANGIPLKVSKIPAYPQYGAPIQTTNRLIQLFFYPGQIYSYATISVEFPVGEIRIKQICTTAADGVYTGIVSNAVLYSNLVGNNPLGFVTLTGNTQFYQSDLRYNYKTPLMVSGDYNFNLKYINGQDVDVASLGDEIIMSIIVEFTAATSSKDYIQNVST